MVLWYNGITLLLHGSDAGSIPSRTTTFRNNMPAVYIYGDEWYPVYSAVLDGNVEGDYIFDVDQETLDRWSTANEAFDIAQSEMYALMSDRNKEINNKDREIVKRLVGI
jgi:hypothetical protein